MSAFSRPIYLRDGHAQTLDRIPIAAGAQGSFSEAWLQQMLFEHPDSLPIRDINPHVGDLIPVCMELGTDAGPADILYMTRTGQIILVETKLWRNAEARRQVVAQILDYAKELSGWTYETLSKAVAMATKKGPSALIECVRQAAPDIDEAVFVDGVNRCLTTGDFILIIAGDGIRRGAEALVGFVQEFGNLRFELALIEVAIFRLPDEAILLQPRILARTETLTRTVFVGQSVQGAPEPMATPENPEKAAVAQWFEQFWTDFLSGLQLDDMTQPLPSRPPRSTNLYFPMPPGSNQAWISAYLAQSSNEGGVFMTFSRSFELGGSFYDELLAMSDVIAEGVPGITWRRDGNGKVWIMAPTVELGDLKDAANRARVIDHLRTQTNRMVNAFRGRMGELCRQHGLP
jgi:hypothetical protein